jgi:cysteine desulfurase
MDYNATAPIKPGVIAAMSACMGDVGNPSSVHGPGRRARHRLDQARRVIAAPFTCDPDHVIFTGSGTEANDLALRGVTYDHLVISAIEHDAIRRCAQVVTKPVSIIPVDADGIVDLNALERVLAEKPGKALVSIMAANNETGVIQPLPEIIRIAHGHGALVHSDAVQAFGKIRLPDSFFEVDLITISAHKFGGPQGVGALISRDVAIEARLLGGAQERYRRAGTENLAGIVGFQTAVELIDLNSGIEALRDRLESEILEHAPDAVIFSRKANRLPNTSMIAMPNVASDTQVIALDLAGLAVSSGAACSSGKVRESHVLSAMGAGDLAGCAIRISLGWNSSDRDVDQFVAAWCRLYDRKRAKAYVPVAAIGN